MRWRWHLAAMTILFAASLAMPAGVARAEDTPNADQLKQMYNDTLAQLKAAQERKTQLASENEQLKAKVAELEKKLAAAESKSGDLEKQVSASTERNFFLRSHYVAWQEFLKRYPRLQIRWKSFVENDLVTPRNAQPESLDPEWPGTAQG